MKSYFGPAITSNGEILVKIGSLYDVYYYDSNTRSFGKTTHRNFPGTILILEIQKRVLGRSWEPHVILPNEHRINFLSLAESKIKGVNWSSGSADLCFYFKELLYYEI